MAAQCTHYEAHINLDLSCSDIQKFTNHQVYVALAKSETYLPRDSPYSQPSTFVCIRRASLSKAESIFEIHEALKVVYDSSVPKFILPFQCEGDFFLLAHKPRGEDLNSFISDKHRRVDMIDRSAINGNIRPSQKLKDILRSLINNIEKFRECSLRPDCDNSKTFIDGDGAFVFTSFRRRESRKDGSFIEWRVTLMTLLASLTSMFPTGTTESTCLGSWLYGVRRHLSHPTPGLHKILLKSEAFFSVEQRVGYLNSLWHAVRKYDSKSIALQWFKPEIKNWHVLAQREPKLENIQILNRRRAKKNETNWVEATDPDLWLLSYTGTQMQIDHKYVISFVRFVRNALAHYDDNEADLISNFNNNVPYNALNDLVDTMDRVWPAHLHRLLDMNVRLNLFD